MRDCILVGRDRVRGKTTRQPALSPILNLQGMISAGEELQAGVVELCRPRRTTLGHDDVQGGFGSERLEPLTLRLPGAVGVRRRDVLWAAAKALQPLIQTMEPIQTAHFGRNAYLRSVVDCLTVRSHIFDLLSKMGQGPSLINLHKRRPNYMMLFIIFGIGKEKSNE
jgi:hypothetical protein